MKKLLLLLGLISTGKIVAAQDKDTVGIGTPFTNNKIVYHKTFKAQGKSAGALFNNSKSWFEKRYYSLDSVKVQDGNNGQLAGTAGETLPFKGPLGSNLSCRAVLNIQVQSVNNGYDITISNVLIGYTDDPAQSRIYFTAENLMDVLLDKKYPKGTGYNPAPFKKKYSKKVLQSLNSLADNIMASISEGMND